MMAPADTAQDLAGAARRLEVLASPHEQDAVASAAAELAQRLE